MGIEICLIKTFFQISKYLPLCTAEEINTYAATQPHISGNWWCTCGHCKAMDTEQE